MPKYWFDAPLVGQNKASTNWHNSVPTVPGYGDILDRPFAEMRTPEDQVHWLYKSLDNAFATYASKGEVSDALNGLHAELVAYIDAAIASEDARVTRLIDELASFVREINRGMCRTRNPVTGEFVPVYTAEKQMYDALRLYAMTWEQLHNTGMTWAALYATGKSWLDIDMYSNVYFGTGKPQILYTPTGHVNTDTPGYATLPSVYKTGYTWAEIKNNGFIFLTEVH